MAQIIWFLVQIISLFQYSAQLAELLGMGMILPATDGKTIIFFSCLFEKNTITFSCVCFKIILFLTQESGLEARRV